MRISYTLWLFLPYPFITVDCKHKGFGSTFCKSNPMHRSLVPFLLLLTKGACLSSKLKTIHTLRKALPYFRCLLSQTNVRRTRIVGPTLLPLKWGQGTNEQMTLKSTAFVMWTNGQFGGRNGLQYKLLSQIQRGLVRSKMSGQVQTDIFAATTSFSSLQNITCTIEEWVNKLGGEGGRIYRPWPLTWHLLVIMPTTR